MFSHPRTAPVALDQAMRNLAVCHQTAGYFRGQAGVVQADEVCILDATLENVPLTVDAVLDCLHEPGGKRLAVLVSSHGGDRCLLIDTTGLRGERSETGAEAKPSDAPAVLEKRMQQILDAYTKYASTCILVKRNDAVAMYEDRNPKRDGFEVIPIYHVKDQVAFGQAGAGRRAPEPDGRVGRSAVVRFEGRPRRGRTPLCPGGQRRLG